MSKPSGIVARPSTESSLWFCFKEGVPMLSAPPAPPIGIFGPDDYVEGERHGCGLWASGYSAALTQAGASPVSLLSRLANRVNYDNALQDVQGILLTGNEFLSGRHIQEAERLCQWCRKKGMPLMGID